jgi:hypothetical protein
MKEKVLELIGEITRRILSGDYNLGNDEAGRKVVKMDDIFIHIQNNNIMFIPFKSDEGIDWFGEIEKRERLKSLEDQERSIKEEISELKNSLHKEKKEQRENKKVKKQSKKQKKDE